MTYEYVCEACGHQWEAEQSIKDAALKKCVACGKNTAKRLVSGGTGFLLKGGGWYADGYGSKSSSTSGEPPTSKGAGDGAGAGGDSGTKSEGAAKSSTPSESTPSKPAEAPPKASSATSTPSAKAS